MQYTAWRLSTATALLLLLSARNSDYVIYVFIYDYLTTRVDRSNEQPKIIMSFAHSIIFAAVASAR